MNEDFKRYMQPYIRSAVTNYILKNYDIMSDEQDVPTDALGNEIKIGDVYGYAQNNNGSVSVTVGVAIKCSTKNLSPWMVKLEVLESRAGYKKTSKYKIIRKYSTIKACHLFRLADYKH